MHEGLIILFHVAPHIWTKFLLNYQENNTFCYIQGQLENMTDHLSFVGKFGISMEQLDLLISWQLPPSVCLVFVYL